MSNDDIVARLRRIGTISDCEVAADEIERLRRKLLAEENAYDILRVENERLLRERDEARRLVCYNDWLYKPGMSARNIAAERGWDCFDRTPNDIEAHEVRGDLAGGT